MGIIDDLIPCMDDILGVRDDIGAIKNGPIYLLTRTWTGQKGRGTFVDTQVQVLPSPHVVNFSHSLRLREGGMIKQGDIMLKHLSKQKYPTEDLLDCTTDNPSTVEKFYYMDGNLYECISVLEDYVYWNVQIRKTNKKT